MTESHYIHGTAPEEQTRLSRLNDLINEGSLREMGLTGGERILDVGSGLGQLTRLMARAAGPTGRVIGIERSREQLELARRLAATANESSLVDFRQGDALQIPLELNEWETFDAAHTRFLLEHVPDPLAVVQSMVRAVRPGGRIVLEDDDHDVMRLSPEPPGFMLLWSAYIRSYDKHGNDPFIGRRLVSLLHRAGAMPRRNTYIFFGSCSGQETFPAFAENLISILGSSREDILSISGIAEKDFEAVIAACHEWKRRPDAAIWFAISWAEGIRRL